VYHMKYENGCERQGKGMQKIRMIATDLDGTLLRRDKTISEYTADVLHRLREKGIIFAVATARPARTMAEDLGFLPIDAGVFHNGAAVFAGGRRIGGWGIENGGSIVRSVLAKRPESRICLESGEILYANFDAGEIWRGISYVPTQDFSEADGKIADKLIIEADTIEKVRSYDAFLPEGVYSQLCEGRLALCMHREATKPGGIRLIADHFGIGMHEIAAFGDDHNDIAMLSACGAGIAVGNAIDEVKRAADHIALSNEEDGVARWIEENIL